MTARIYTNIELPQAELPSTVVAVARLIVTHHLICQHSKEAAAIEQHSHQP
jgi:hypothetical protein